MTHLRESRLVSSDGPSKTSDRACGGIKDEPRVVVSYRVEAPVAVLVPILGSRAGSPTTSNDSYSQASLRYEREGERTYRSWQCLCACIM